MLRGERVLVAGVALLQTEKVIVAGVPLLQDWPCCRQREFLLQREIVPVAEKVLVADVPLLQTERVLVAGEKFLLQECPCCRSGLVADSESSCCREIGRLLVAGVAL